MNEYKITPLKLGTITRPRCNMSYGSSDNETMDYPLISYYLCSDAHKIIIDTGGSTPKEGDIRQPYSRQPDEEMDAALAKIGVQPGEIDYVLFTHLHWDHAQNNHFFTNAKFIAQAKEVAAFLSGGDKGYEEQEFGETVYDTIDGDADILPGIKALLVPGHSKGSQAFVVNTPDGDVLITGDLVPCYENWESEPKIPSSTIEDYDAAVESYAKLSALGIDKIFPGHEMGVFAE